MITGDSETPKEGTFLWNLEHSNEPKWIELRAAWAAVVNQIVTGALAKVMTYDFKKPHAYIELSEIIDRHPKWDERPFLWRTALNTFRKSMKVHPTNQSFPEAAKEAIEYWGLLNEDMEQAMGVHEREQPTQPQTPAQATTALSNALLAELPNDQRFEPLRNWLQSLDLTSDGRFILPKEKRGNVGRLAYIIERLYGEVNEFGKPFLCHKSDRYEFALRCFTSNDLAEWSAKSLEDSASHFRRGSRPAPDDVASLFPAE
jgi:hypothetical protein